MTAIGIVREDAVTHQTVAMMTTQHLRRRLIIARHQVQVPRRGEDTILQPTEAKSQKVMEATDTHRRHHRHTRMKNMTAGELFSPSFVNFSIHLAFDVVLCKTCIIKDFTSSILLNTFLAFASEIRWEQKIAIFLNRIGLCRLDKKIIIIEHFAIFVDKEIKLAQFNSYWIHHFHIFWCYFAWFGFFIRFISFAGISFSGFFYCMLFIHESGSFSKH